MAHRLSAKAEAELDNIWRHIAQESGSTDVAKRIIAGITDRFHLLAAHPYSGRSRSDLRPGLRGFLAGDYLILYRIEGADVVILHVIHGRRDLPRLIR